MRQGKVFLRDLFAGIITEDEKGYHFHYDSEFLASSDAEAIFRKNGMK